MTPDAMKSNSKGDIPFYDPDGKVLQLLIDNQTKIFDLMVDVGAELNDMKGVVEQQSATIKSTTKLYLLFGAALLCINLFTIFTYSEVVIPTIIRKLSTSLVVSHK